MNSNTATTKLYLPVAGAILLVVFWSTAAAFVGNPSNLPGPITTGRAALKLLSDGYWRDLLVTSVRACGALGLALAIGVPIGLLLGWSPKAYDSFRAILAFLRCLPAFMLITIPVALGYGGEFARIVTAAAASAWIISDECAESLRTLPRERVEILEAFRASNLFILTRLMFFEAVGRVIVPSVKTNIGICFIVIIVVESLAIPAHGVGARLLTWMSSSEMPAVWGFLFLTGLAGVVLNFIVHELASALIFWK